MKWLNKNKAVAEPEIEKENAELKKRNAELAGQKASLGRWFGEAKEIIKDFLLMAKVEHLEERYESVEEAERFLSEVAE